MNKGEIRQREGQDLQIQLSKMQIYLKETPLLDFFLLPSNQNLPKKFKGPPSENFFASM